MKTLNTHTATTKKGLTLTFFIKDNKVLVNLPDGVGELESANEYAEKIGIIKDGSKAASVSKEDCWVLKAMLNCVKKDRELHVFNTYEEAISVTTQESEKYGDIFQLMMDIEDRPHCAYKYK